MGHRNRLTAATFKTSGGMTTKQIASEYDPRDGLIRRRVDTNADGTFDDGEWFVHDGENVVLTVPDATLARDTRPQHTASAHAPKRPRTSRHRFP